MTTPTGILFEEPVNQPLSANGLPQSGCYYCFFTTGTTTLANVYSNGTLSTPLSQPTPGSVNPSAGTVANASGQFAPIYLTPGVIYRRQLYSAAGLLLSDVDPYVVQNAAAAVSSSNTWTAAQTMTPASGVALTLNAASANTGLLINGVANQYAAQFLGVNIAGQSQGVLIGAGTNASDTSLLIQNTSGTSLFKVAGSGAVSGYGPTAAALVDMTPDKGSWSSTLSGPWVAGSNVTCTLKWERQGTQVTVWCDAGNAQTVSSTSTALTASGLPASITPSSQRLVACVIEDNSTNTLAQVTINTSNILVFSPLTTNSSANPVHITPFLGWTNAAFAGIPTGFSITYSL